MATVRLGLGLVENRRAVLRLLIHGGGGTVFFEAQRALEDQLEGGWHLPAGSVDDILADLVIAIAHKDGIVLVSHRPHRPHELLGPEIEEHLEIAKVHKNDAPAASADQHIIVHAHNGNGIQVNTKGLDLSLLGNIPDHDVAVFARRKEQVLRRIAGASAQLRDGALMARQLLLDHHILT